MVTFLLLTITLTCAQAQIRFPLRDRRFGTAEPSSRSQVALGRNDVIGSEDQDLILFPGEPAVLRFDEQNVELERFCRIVEENQNNLVGDDNKHLKNDDIVDKLSIVNPAENIKNYDLQLIEKFKDRPNI